LERLQGWREQRIRVPKIVRYYRTLSVFETGYSKPLAHLMLPHARRPLWATVREKETGVTRVLVLYSGPPFGDRHGSMRP